MTNDPQTPDSKDLPPDPEAQSSPSEGSASNEPTQAVDPNADHYDDGHSFGWKQPGQPNWTKLAPSQADVDAAVGESPDVTPWTASGLTPLPSDVGGAVGGSPDATASGFAYAVKLPPPTGQLLQEEDWTPITLEEKQKITAEKGANYFDANTLNAAGYRVDPENPSVARDGAGHVAVKDQYGWSVGYGTPGGSGQMPWEVFEAAEANTRGYVVPDPPIFVPFGNVATDARLALGGWFKPRLVIGLGAGAALLFGAGLYAGGALGNDSSVPQTEGSALGSDPAQPSGAVVVPGQPGSPANDAPQASQGSTGQTVPQPQQPVIVPQPQVSPEPQVQSQPQVAQQPQTQPQTQPQQQTQPAPAGGAVISGIYQVATAIKRNSGHPSDLPASTTTDLLFLRDRSVEPNTVRIEMKIAGIMLVGGTLIGPTFDSPGGSFSASATAPYRTYMTTWVFDGRVGGGEVSGDLTIGGDGRLPGGGPIVYSIQGTRQ